MTISQPTRAIEEIKRGVRHRKDYGDLDALARSIDEKGLLQPIAITPQGYSCRRAPDFGLAENEISRSAYPGSYRQP